MKFLFKIIIFFNLIYTFAQGENVDTSSIFQDPLPKKSFSYDTGLDFVSFESYISVANFFLCRKDLSSFNPEIVEKGNIILLPSNLINIFIEHIHPKINENYILLIWGDVSYEAVFNINFLDSPKIVLWGVVNCLNPEHPKIIPIPIGITHPSHPPYYPKRENYFDILSKKDSIDKEIFCISNFNLFTAKSRQILYESIKNKEFITFYKNMPHKKYFETLFKADFCISPPGNGLDCFRHWECILAGCIPIIKHSPIDPLFFKMPVYFVNEYESLTRENLTNALNDLRNGEYEFDKLYARYWNDFFLEIQNKIKNDEDCSEKIKLFKNKTFGL